MATKLFLRNTTTNGITGSGDGILYDLSTTAGSSVDTAVTNTTASGTQIQATKTGGGSTVAWISGRAPVGGFTLTNTDISLWQVESNMNANIGGRYRVFKRSAAGVITEVGGGPFDDGAEMNTADREDLWTGNVTDTVFAEDDRILIRYYITNIGTMASGHTGTMKFNAADAQTGDSFFNIAETITFKPNAQTISSVGNIASAEAFGTQKVNRTVSPSGIASAQAFGTTVVSHELTIADDLVSFWKLGENTGTTRNDSAGPNHLSDIGSGVTKVSPGKIGDAAGFDETAYLRVLDNASLSITGNMSMWAWVRLNASGTLGFPGIAGKWGSGDQRSYSLRYERSLNRFLFSVTADGISASHAIFNGPSNNVWYFIRAYVDLDNDEIAISVTANGAGSLASWNTASFTGASIFDGTADFEVGRLGTSGDVFYGDIDGPGIAARKYSEANWASIWNNGNGIEIVSPIAKAGFDQTRMELETVFLDGSQSLGNGITVLWEQVSGTAVTINNATTLTPNFTAPDVASPTSLVFKITVTDEDEATEEDQVTIRIVPTGSDEWLWHTPLEAHIGADVLHNTMDSVPSPALFARDGRIVASKGDITLEGFVWSASKPLTALIAAREIHLGNIDYDDLIPDSDFPSGPEATLQQFLSMTSDYGLTPHSPGDHFAYNNGSAHHYGTHLKTTFYAGQDHVETLQDAYVTALGFEDTLTYAGFMSGWDGGWSMSARDLLRIAQLVLQGGAWDGTQVLDRAFVSDGLWQAQIPEAASPHDDLDDEFYNQNATLDTDVMHDGWSLGWWILGPTTGHPVEMLTMLGKFGTSVYISREYDLIALCCNTGGSTNDDATTKISGDQFGALANAVEDPPNQFLSSAGGIASAQGFGATQLGARVAPGSIASAEAFGTLTASQAAIITPPSIGSEENFGDALLVLTVSTTGIASAEAFGTPSPQSTISPSSFESQEAFGVGKLSRNMLLSAIVTGEAFGSAVVQPDFVTLALAGISSAESFGATTLAGFITIAPSAVGSTEAFGTPTLSRTISLNAIPSAEAFGTMVVQRAPVTLTLSAIESAETFGTTSIETAGTIALASIASAEAFGSSQISRSISLTGISSTQAFGSPHIARSVSLINIASLEAFGTPVVQLGGVSISATGIVSGEAFGTAILERGGVIVTASSISTAESVSSPQVLSAWSIQTNGIASSETFGSPALVVGAVTITLSGITSSLAFGSPTVTDGAFNLRPAPTAGISVMAKPIATISVQLNGSATITKWPS